MKYYFKCPGCESDDEFTLLREESSGLGFWLFIIGGFLPALMYADATRHRIQCSKCSYIFRQPPLPRTSLSRLSTWIIWIIIVFGVCTFLMIAVPEIDSLLPQSQVLNQIEQFISNNPSVILFGLFPMIALILILCLLGSWFSNRAAHREFRKEFETKPKR
jgi:hypothetical protein